MIAKQDKPTEKTASWHYNDKIPASVYENSVVLVN
jgi:hypothetical protein